ncbi:PREDICTED: homeobox protein orthopedia-like [Nelumbo nucifera]|uniref:Homeobox protein orthopedia-like n=1 Tax=Nelumbo nucifera TaxID=4432 RepID=A0A1U8QBR6_NELNU|nr:PREDICTED: homeobox protein orthopedia-like [Nelumbo nucifera]
MKKMSRALSETDLREHAVLKKITLGRNLTRLPSISVEEEEEQEVGIKSRASSLERLLSSSSLGEATEAMDEGCAVGVKDNGLATLPVGGGVGSDCGRICGGGGGGGGSNGGDGERGSGFSNSNYGNDCTNVRGDLAKAEEYCGRAILANPSDQNVVTLCRTDMGNSKRLLSENLLPERTSLFW